MTRTFHSSKLLAFLVSIFFGGFARGADDAAGIEFFEKKIRPVLVASCYECHSAAKGKHEVVWPSIIGRQFGKEAIWGRCFEPGKPADSLLMKALHQTGKLKMPPKKMLSPEVIADFAKWITMGAPDRCAGSTGPASGSLMWKRASSTGRSAPCSIRPPNPNRVHGPKRRWIASSSIA